jgi:S1-C subfamily serine protease
MKLWLAALLSVLVGGGCAHLATPEEKEVSYRRFLSAKVDGKDLGEFLAQRSAIIIAGAEPVVVATRQHDVDIRLQPVEKDGFDLGSASEITADGYFLTAAHCVRRRPLYLLLPMPASERITPARLVWSPPDSSCDIAIIKVDFDSLRPAFAIAEDGDLKPGADVVTAGANGLAAGKVLGASEAVVANEPSGLPEVQAILHSAPLAEGDSGGPLATLDGKLLGIEVLARGLWLGTSQGIALRPDPVWLRKVIARDRLAHLATTRTN